MGIFDLFGGYLIGGIIEPASSYEVMQNKIESNKEGTIKDDNHDVESIEPEHDFNGLKTDIMNDFDNYPDKEDGNGIITDDNR